MSFQPYELKGERLPKLSIGYVLKIGKDYYVVVESRRGRHHINLVGVQTGTRIYIRTNATYALFHGNLTQGRIVHLQYVALENAVDTQLYWGTLPLMSIAVETFNTPDGALTSQTAPKSVGSPLEIDRWSYQDEMHLAVSQLGTQVYVIERMEYVVVPYKGTVNPDKFLQLLSTGEAVFTPPAWLSNYIMGNRSRGVMPG